MSDATEIVEGWLAEANRRIHKDDVDERRPLETSWILEQFEGHPPIASPKERLQLAKDASEIAIGRVTRDSRWDTFAANVMVQALHEITPKSYKECVRLLYHHKDEDGKHYPRVSHDVNRLAFLTTGTEIQNALRPERDYGFTYQGIQMVIATYLLRDTTMDIPIETPQFMYMRMSCGLHSDDIHEIICTYDLLSTGKISHATPWMYNLGTPTPNIASCFLYNTGVTNGDRDSIAGFYDTIKTTAIISANGGGCGLNFHEVRGEGTLIKGCGGRAVGLTKLLQQFNTLADYVDQGRRRKAAIACYLEPWHAGIKEFLQLLLKTGDETQRTYNLHTALWVPDLFMKRCEEDGDWPLFCPKKCPGLNTRHGEEFEKLFLEYEQQGRANEVVKARDILDMVLVSLSDSGEPYILFKDTANRHDNQQLGTIENSNLCVPWEAKLWTQEYGPVPIGSLVPSDTKTYEEEQHASFDKKLEMWRSKLPDIYDEDEPEPEVADILSHINDLELAKKALPLPPQCAKEPKPVHIFTGETWTKVTPKLTGKKKDLIRIETSHGVRMDCTPEHRWVLESGEFKTADQLNVGDRLVYTRPIIHKPEKPEDITEHDAFMIGAVYAYGLRMKGTVMHDNVHLNLSAKTMQLRRETLMDRALEMFGYDRKVAEADHPKVDHDKFVIIEVPPHLSQMRPLFNATVEKRMAWVAGYVSVTEGGHHTYCITCYKMLRPVVDMFRSTGEHVKMIPVGRTGGYLLCPVNITADKERDVPTVNGKFVLNAKEDVYCVSSKYGKAAFEGGQVTGNCTEIYEFNDTENISCCVLGALGVDEFVMEDGSYDFEGLHAATKVAVKNCDRAIDVMNYALKEMERSNKATRPVGVGIMGFHTMLQKLRMAWVDESGKKANYAARVHCAHVHETMYHAAIEATCDLSDAKGPHPTFLSSAASRGKLHFDLYDKPPEIPFMYDDWDVLRLRSSKGRRNSLLIAMMPTASTSMVRGKSEGRNPIQSNVFKSKIMCGEFPIINMQLEPYLRERKLWTADFRSRLLTNKGSVRGLGLPKDVEQLFATAWEIPQSVVIEFAADAQYYVDQGMSTTIHYETPTPTKIKKVLFYAWKKQLKTGMYYLRSQPADDGINIDLPTEQSETEGCAGGSCTL